MAQQMRQKQVLAPQMRQSLEVLQLQVQDLRVLAQQELDQNPTLEALPDEGVSIEAEREAFEGDPNAEEPDFAPHEELADFDDAPDVPDHFETPREVPYETSVSEERTREEPDDFGEAGDAETVRETDADGAEADLARDFGILSELDDDDYLYQDGGNNEYNPDAEERRQFMFDSIAVAESLQEHLLGQLELSELEEEDLPIAEQIIGSIGDDGYLRTPLADVAQVVPGASLEDCERILEVVQDFTPAGVGARDLRECLLIQIRRSALAGSLVEIIVRDYLELLGARQLTKIAKLCDVSREKVEQAVAELKRFEPRPGAAFNKVAPQYIEPEIEVRKVDGHYQAFVEDTNIPHLRISHKYSTLLHASGVTDETREYIQGKIRSGINLIKSIEQRQETIRKVAQRIVDAQQEFFDKGITALRPLVMAEIAEAVGIHETTVSRTVSNKYMRSPQGIHEMRFFFTNGIATTSGESVSSEHVKVLIKQMVDNEDPMNPLADQDIEKNLADKGINIARRTIAKYRGVLKIQPSHLRRRQ